MITLRSIFPHLNNSSLINTQKATYDIYFITELFNLLLAGWPFPSPHQISRLFYVFLTEALIFIKPPQIYKQAYVYCVLLRNRGRQRRRWTDDITEWTGMKINEVAAAAEDRDCWREILRSANLSDGGWH